MIKRENYRSIDVVCSYCNSNMSKSTAIVFARIKVELKWIWVGRVCSYSYLDIGFACNRAINK